MVCPAILYFSTLSHKRQDLRKNVIEHKMYVLCSLHNMSEKFLMLRRTERDIIINVHRSSDEVFAIVVIF